MVTSSCCISSCSNAGGAYTTNKERLTFEKEIEERIYCIAGHVSDEQSAQSFLSQVRDPCATYNKVQMGVEVPYDLLGILYHQIQIFQAEDINQDWYYHVMFRIEFDYVEKLEEAIKNNCSQEVVFY